MSRALSWFRGAPSASRTVRRGYPLAWIGSGDSAAVQAQYEATRLGPDRTWLPGYAQDAGRDIDEATRMEILRRVRYFEKNSAVLCRILDLIECNVVGSGITATPASSDAKWNAEAAKAWRKWSKLADYTSRQNFETLQAVIARAMCVDGEIFVYLANGQQGRPRLQLIESHRVVSAGKLTGFESYIDAGGVLLDERGRPAHYVVSGGAVGKVTVLPAERVIHFFEPSRAGQYRGLSLFHAVLHTLHDLDDLQKYEMIAAKDAASRANVVTTATGEAPSLEDFATGEAPSESASAQSVAAAVNYERAFGAKTVVLRPGEDWKQAESLRPSAAMRDFWEYLTKQVARGSGISYAALEDYQGWGGAALRAAVVADNRFYAVRTAAISTGFQRIYEAVISHAQSTGEIPQGPEDWREVRWQPPRRASVDIGRDSAATLNDLRAGLRTFRDLCAEVGVDWREALTQRAEEEALIDELAAKHGVSRARISSLVPSERQPPAEEAEPASGARSISAS